MYDVHIEFAHIYGDQPFGDEQAKSAMIFNEMKERLRGQYRSVVSTTLIDDYHADHQLWNNHLDLIERLKAFGELPDIVFKESSFTELAEELISQIPDEYKRVERFKKEKKQVLFYSDGKRKFALKDMFEDHARYKCVVLSLAWLMCKLGVMNYPVGSYQMIQSVPIYSAERVVSILDKRYQVVESNVMYLLQLLEGNQMEQRVQYIFF